MKNQPVMKLAVLLFLLLSLAACGAEPASSSAIMDTTVETAVNCQEATTDLQPLHNPRHGYCLRYPAEYKVEKPSENETILVIGGLLNAGDPRVHIAVEQAGDRTALEVADQIAADFPPEFGIERSSLTVGNEPAELLDLLPGQDINRQVIFVHEGLLYNLMFSPILDNDNQPYERMKTFYNQIMDSFTFISQSDEVIEECLVATSETQLLKNEAHGYCLLLPADYKVEQPNDNESVFFVGSLMDVTHPKLFITVQDAAEQTAALAAEELMADFSPDFDIEPVGGVTIGYAWAERLDNVPGQDMNRVLFVEHSGRIYKLTFTPASQDAGEVYTQMEVLYDLAIKSFRFLP